VLSALPPWSYGVLWSAATILIVLLMGHLLTVLLTGRLTRWAARTSWEWDDAVIDALRRGVPFWSVLFGLYVATGFWPFAPHQVEIIARVFYVLGWLWATVIFAGLGGRLITAYGKLLQPDLPMASLTENFVKIIIVLLGALMILHGLGISIAPLLTALGVGGLAVALALQDTLSNLFSGLHLTMSRNVRVGDYVKLENGSEGYVDDIGWRATTVRTLSNNMVVMPNKKLAESVITNFHMPSREVAVTVEIGAAYGADLERIQQVTVEVAREVLQTVPGGIAGFEPMVRFHTFGDSAVQFTAVLRAKEFTDQYLIKHEFIKRLHARYARDGISIPFPTHVQIEKPAEG